MKISPVVPSLPHSKTLLYIGSNAAEAHPVGMGYRNSAHALARSRRRILHLDRLRTEVAPQQRVLAGSQRGLVDIELVGVDRALHDGFAEAVGSGYEYDIAETGVGVEREHDTAGAEVTAHHVLDAR